MVQATTLPSSHEITSPMTLRVSDSISAAPASPEAIAVKTPAAQGARAATEETGVFHRNFALMVAFQVWLRVGWILKTESVVMPAVLDSIGAGAWVRALLPSLNRLGQTIPPIFHAKRLEGAEYKKWPLASWTILMGVAFWGVAAIWPWRDAPGFSGWFTIVFLAGYAIFFTATGINQVGYSTLQGKLIPAHRRGRLMSVANSVGVVAAVACAAWVMPQCLSATDTHFDWLFVIAGACFVACGLCAVVIAEPPSATRSVKQRAGLKQRLALSWTIFLRDRQMRMLMLVAWACGSSLILFPHYQPMGRARLGLGFDQIVTWVIVQNIGAAFFSAPFGWLADRWGNRFVLRLSTGLMGAGPILAWGASHLGNWGAWFYPAVFFFLGLTPVFMKLMSNYVLELVDEEQHPAYLATLGLALGLPTILLSPVAGIAIDYWGFDGVFAAVTTMIGLGFLGTWWLIEPREEGARELPSDGKS